MGHVRKTANSLKYWRGKRAHANKKRLHALHQAHIWRNKLAAAKAAFKRAVAAEKKAHAHHVKAAAAHAKAKAHRIAVEKKFGVAKAAHIIAQRRFRKGRAAAIRANNAVNAHVKEGVRKGHM